MDLKAEERTTSVDDLAAAFRMGRLSEAFACGTAAAVTPIREIVHQGEVIYRNEGPGPGERTRQLRQRLLDLQFGLAPDPFGWRLTV
jgi:branched-chain amino acid aminotransferase